MPPLDNRRWERFAQELAKGKTACEAYVLAGYKREQGGSSIRLLEDGQRGTARIRAIVRDNYRRSAPTPPAPKNIVDTLLEKFGPKAD